MRQRAETRRIPGAAAPREVLDYVAAVRPRVADALDARADWLAALEAAGPFAEWGRVRAARRSLDLFRRARGQVGSASVPPTHARLHAALLSWLAALADSAAAVADADGGRPEARLRLRAVGAAAEAFNAERTYLIQHGETAFGLDAPARARADRTAVWVAAAALLLLVPLALAAPDITLAGRGTTAVRAPTSLPATATPIPVERRTYSRSALLAMLTTGLRLQGADVDGMIFRLDAPDRVLIDGVFLRGDVPVMAELRVSVGPDGLPVLTPIRSKGELTRVVAWANDRLVDELGPVSRILVEPDGITVETDGA